MLAGAKQEGTSDVAYSRITPSSSKMKERLGRLVPWASAAGKPNRRRCDLPPLHRRVPAVLKTCAVVPSAMDGADDRWVHTPCQGDGRRPVVVRAAPDARQDDTARARSHSDCIARLDRPGGSVPPLRLRRRFSSCPSHLGSATAERRCGSFRRRCIRHQQDSTRR